MNSHDYKQANLLKSKSDETQELHLPMQKKWIYCIEERRKEVAQMLAQGHTETEIALILNVHVSTICRDVKMLKDLFHFKV
jgi:DNA-binding NarL/FixJ family response regulator